MRGVARLFKLATFTSFLYVLYYVLLTVSRGYKIECMDIFEQLRFRSFQKHWDSIPRKAHVAYNLWADAYDAQPGNLMLAWDEEIFSLLLNDLSLQNKIIADIGCGTGRHWQKIFDLHPKRLIGFDVSEGMLKMLKQKFPESDTHHLKGGRLKHIEYDSFDIVFSTLTIAHIENVEKALTEWKHVLKPGGEMVITDYHPTALKKGGKRTFSYNGKTITVKNYVHSIDKIKNIAAQLDLEVVRLVEKSIDPSAKSYYQKQNAIAVYQAWKGTPIIYGIHLKKPDVVK